MFYNCSSLITILIPNSVTSIGGAAFYGTGITSIILPNSLTTLGGNAFAKCKSLTSVTIPKGLASIGNYCFSNSTSLSEINYLGTMEEWASIEKGDSWIYSTKVKTIRCVDGEAHP